MEEMSYVFGVATREHMRYQVKEVFPWCIDHYIRRRQGLELEPLYRYARAGEDSNKTADEIIQTGSANERQTGPAEFEISDINSHDIAA